MTKLVPVWWTVIAGLAAAVVSIVSTSFIAGQKLAVLDQLPPALQQLQKHERILAVMGANCCPVTLQISQADNTSARHRVW